MPASTKKNTASGPDSAGCALPVAGGRGVALLTALPAAVVAEVGAGVAVRVAVAVGAGVVGVAVAVAVVAVAVALLDAVAVALEVAVAEGEALAVAVAAATTILPTIAPLAMPASLATAAEAWIEQ